MSNKNRKSKKNKNKENIDNIDKKDNEENKGAETVLTSRLDVYKELEAINKRVANVNLYLAKHIKYQLMHMLVYFSYIHS